jgi:hypothetical protein
MSNHTVQLVLWKTMTSNTLAAILGHRLTWRYARALSVDGFVRAITTITLYNGAYLLSGTSASGSVFRPTMGGLSKVFIRHTGADVRTQTSIREICRYISPVRSHMSIEQLKALRKDLVINISKQVHIPFWLLEVSSR